MDNQFRHMIGIYMLVKSYTDTRSLFKYLILLNGRGMCPNKADFVGTVYRIVSLSTYKIVFLSVCVYLFLFVSYITQYIE